MKEKNKSFLIQLVISAIIATPIVWYVIDMISHMDEGNVGTGEVIPKQAPNELDRVHHSDGFSMISPPGWRVDITSNKLSFTIGKRMQREYGVISATKWTINKNIEKLADPQKLRKDISTIDFNGQSAIVFSRQQGAAISTNLSMQNNKEKWELQMYHRGDNNGKIPDVYWNYLKTFRVEATEKTDTK